MELYSCRTIPNGYRMAKFDENFDLLATYEMVGGCSCFQAQRHTCRHREMLTVFINRNRVDTGHFLNYEDFTWLKPLQLGDKQEIERRI